VTQIAAGYAFLHTNIGESRRLDLFVGRLDPVSKRRIGQLGLGPAVHCLAIGTGREAAEQVARALQPLVRPQTLAAEGESP
jgi:hypothetical protein